MILRGEFHEGDRITLTDEQQGGTAPALEAEASGDAPATEQTVATIAVADEPAAPETSPEPGTITDGGRPPAPAVAERGGRHRPLRPIADEAPRAAPVARGEAVAVSTTVEDEAADAPPAADIEPEDEAPALPARADRPRADHDGGAPRRAGLGHQELQAR